MSAPQGSGGVLSVASSGGTSGISATPSSGGAPAPTSPPFTGFADAGAGLQARIQVNGNDLTCGACDVLLVQAQGGKGPYTYSWNDPSLTGPGPHTICPTEAKHLSVVVTDASKVDAPEFNKPAQTVEATVDLTCTPAPPDAGPPEDDGINGCLVLAEQEKVACSDAGVTEPNVNSNRIPFTPIVGKTYQYTYDQLLPIGIGTPSTVDVYLGMAPCDRAQKVFTLTLDNVWTQTFCFTVDRPYTYSTAVVHVNGIPFTFGVTPTVCDTCKATSP